MSKVLVPLLLMFLFVFTVVMVIGFFVTGSEPATLIMSVFGAVTGELLGMATIKNNKIKKGDNKHDDNGFIA